MGVYIYYKIGCQHQIISYYNNETLRKCERKKRVSHRVIKLILKTKMAKKQLCIVWSPVSQLSNVCGPIRNMKVPASAMKFSKYLNVGAVSDCHYVKRVDYIPPRWSHHPPDHMTLRGCIKSPNIHNMTPQTGPLAYSMFFFSLPNETVRRNFLTLNHQKMPWRMQNLFTPHTIKVLNEFIF